MATAVGVRVSSLAPQEKSLLSTKTKETFQYLHESIVTVNLKMVIA